jgi:hypothetical protein
MNSLMLFGKKYTKHRQIQVSSAEHRVLPIPCLMKWCAAAAGPFPEMSVRTGVKKYLESTTADQASKIAMNEEAVTKIIDALRRKKIAQSVLGGAAQSLDSLEQLPIGSDIIGQMFDLQGCKGGSNALNNKSPVWQLVEKFVVCVYSLSKQENVQAAVRRRAPHIERLFPANGTFGNFLDLFFKEFPKSPSMLNLIESNAETPANNPAEKNGKAAAADQNAEQINRLSAHGTVWHAVSAFAKEQGKASAHARARRPTHPPAGKPCN